MAHIYNGILLSHKKEWNNAICSNIGGPRDYHTKWKKNIIWCCLNVDSKKKSYKWTYLQNRNRVTDLSNKLMVSQNERWEDG